MKLRTNLLIIISIALILVGCSENEPFPDIQLPKYPSAIGPKLLIDKPVKGAKALVYEVNIPFPAKDVIKFFDEEISKLGFHQTPAEGIATFKWENINLTNADWKETNKVPARYTASWANPDKSIRIWLYMAYKYNNNDPNWKDTLSVSCNISEYFE